MPTLILNKKMKIPPPAKVFSDCASLIVYLMTLKSVIEVTVPPQTRRFLISLLQSHLHLPSQRRISVIIEDRNKSGVRNSTFDDAMEYFGSKICGSGKKIRVSRETDARNLSFSLSPDDVVFDEFEGIRIQYRYSKVLNNNPEQINSHEYIEISFEERYRETVLYAYLPYVERRAAEMRSSNKVIMMHTNVNGTRWEKMRLVHPSKFETMAMNPEVKNSVIQDVEKFIKRKDYYRKVGKAWKRGYLLYGPPGTGKTSLVAAIANHLNFDIYDLQLTAIQDYATLRKTLSAMKNGSILLLEDIDRSAKLQPKNQAVRNRTGLFMSGLLNCIDWLWYSCGEEWLIIFTTNNKDAIDPALLRPGRMDVHVNMTYVCFEGFKTLAANYLDIVSDHHLFPEVETLICENLVMPVEVSEDFMKAEDANSGMESLVKRLKSNEFKKRSTVMLT